MKASPPAARLLGALLLTVQAVSGGVSPGELDGDFAPHPNNNMSGILTQPDERMILLGNFSNVTGVSKNFLARLDPAGVLDTGFTASSAGGNGFTNPGVFCGAVQTDGRIVVAGLFAFVNGVARSFVGRVLPNGALDTGYTASCGDQVRGLVMQPDGRVVLVGYFTSVNNVARNRVARLHTDGTLDNSFNPDANGITRTVALQADGKLIIGGNFTTVGGTARNRVARLNADGTVDLSFNPGADGNVYCVAVQADGKIIIGGTFANAGGAARSNIARFHANGTLDTAFNPGASANLRSSTVQADGKIIIAGEFTTVAGTPRTRVARLLPTGALDTTLLSSANDTITGVTLQPDGMICLSGEFSNVGGVFRDNLARLYNDSADQELNVVSPTRVEWLRGGSSPEAFYVTLEISTIPGVWSAPLAGVRMDGGWLFTGLSLTGSGTLRARARIAGGYNNGSAGLVETTAAYSVQTPLQTWRQTHFGTPDNAGIAADNADADQDGVENLAEFAFGLHPRQPDAALLPAWQLSDDDYMLNFTSPAGVSGVTYIAERSSSMAPGSWTPLTNFAAPPAHLYFTPAEDGLRRFLRVRVISP